MNDQILDAQQQYWNTTLSQRTDMFGVEPSEAARRAAEKFHEHGLRRLLELGGGQGRDAVYFASQGFEVQVLDYAESAVNVLTAKAQQLGIPHRLAALQHDVRDPLPFPDGSFDACYSHMLYCMALTTSQLGALSAEVLRVLRPNGVQVFTVRHTADPHYGTGTQRGEHMYEVGGFIVHFFSPEMVAQIARGYEVLSLEQFEEGGLPRRLFLVTSRKAAAQRLQAASK